jgi:hypothetical protein
VRPWEKSRWPMKARAETSPGNSVAPTTQAISAASAGGCHSRPCFVSAAPPRNACRRQADRHQRTDGKRTNERADTAHAHGPADAGRPDGGRIVDRGERNEAGRAAAHERTEQALQQDDHTDGGAA